jgi:hypothetical protein
MIYVFLAYLIFFIENNIHTNRFTSYIVNYFFHFYNGKEDALAFARATLLVQTEREKKMQRKPH